MPLVVAVDYTNKLIFLGADSVGVDVQPIDIYKEMRARRRLNADNDRKFFPMITAFGNESTGPSTSTPRYANLASGVRIVPFDTPHSLLIRGNLISTSEGINGRDLFDRSSLTSEVDIDYQPPQVEIITVSAGGVQPSDVWTVDLGGETAGTKLTAARSDSDSIIDLLCNNGDIVNNPDGTRTVTLYQDDGSTIRAQLQISSDGLTRTRLI